MMNFNDLSQWLQSNRVRNVRGSEYSLSGGPWHVWKVLNSVISKITSSCRPKMAWCISRVWWDRWSITSESLLPPFQKSPKCAGTNSAALRYSALSDGCWCGEGHETSAQLYFLYLLRLLSINVTLIFMSVSVCCHATDTVVEIPSLMTNAS